MKTFKEIREGKDKQSPVYHIVTQGEGDNKQKVMGVYTDVKKAISARDAWNKKNTVAKPSHKARVYSQKPFWDNKAPKVGSAISWSTYSNKDHYTKAK